MFSKRAVQRCLQYYPPDIDLLKLSSQDPLLKALGLKDVRMHQRLVRQQAMEARGKNIRVGVIDGPRRPQEKKPKKKK